MEKIIMKKIDEVIYHEELKNGLNVYIYKKNGFAKKGAFFVTHYGSSNNEFVPTCEKEMVSFPKGIAHFLEHKLFESSDNEGVFEKFKKFGADVNAFTNHLITNYYFSCTDNFYPCLEELVNFVLSPYFTDENVEKEKPIINEEINMTSDNVDRYIFEEMFNMTLNTNPNKYRTIGDKKSISKITKDDLYRCYNTFYNPSNMVLVLYGNIDPTKTISLIKGIMKSKGFNKSSDIKIKEYDEDVKVCEEYKEVKKNVVIPKVGICYKIKVPKLTGVESHKRLLFLDMLLDMKFGFSVAFEKNLIKDGIIKTGLDMNYSCFDDVILLMFSSDTDKKDLFIEKIDEKLRENLFDEKLFELNKKVLTTNLVRLFESPSNVASMIYNYIIKHGEIIENAYDIYKNYDFDEFKHEFNTLNFDNKSVLYVTKKE